MSTKANLGVNPGTQSSVGIITTDGTDASGNKLVSQIVTPLGPSGNAAEVSAANELYIRGDALEELREHNRQIILLLSAIHAQLSFMSGQAFTADEADGLAKLVQ